MLNYLVKFTHIESGKVFYKRGVSMWGPRNILEKRFSEPHYSPFKIELLESFYFSHTNRKVAEAVTYTFEQILNGIWPPKKQNFNVEEYLGMEPNSLNNAGVTEFIFLKEGQIEDNIVKVFKCAKKHMWKVKKQLEEV